MVTTEQPLELEKCVKDSNIDVVDELVLYIYSGISVGDISKSVFGMCVSALLCWFLHYILFIIGRVGNNMPLRPWLRQVFSLCS